MLRMISDVLICAYATLVLRGQLGTMPYASVVTMVFGFFCGWQLQRAWRAQGLVI